MEFHMSWKGQIQHIPENPNSIYRGSWASNRWGARMRKFEILDSSLEPDCERLMEYGKLSPVGIMVSSEKVRRVTGCC